jgi:hypothetical protein
MAAAAIPLVTKVSEASFVKALLKLLGDGRAYLKLKGGSFGVKEQVVLKFIIALAAPDSRRTLAERKKAFDKDNATLIIEARARPGLHQGFSNYWKAVDEFFAVYGSNISNGIIRFEEETFVNDLKMLLHHAGIFLAISSVDPVISELQKMFYLFREMLLTPDEHALGLRWQKFFTDDRIIKIREFLMPKSTFLYGYLSKISMPLIVTTSDDAVFKNFLGELINFVAKHNARVISIDILKQLPLSRLIDGLTILYNSDPVKSNFERDLYILIHLGCVNIEQIAAICKESEDGGLPASFIKPLSLYCKLIEVFIVGLFSAANTLTLKDYFDRFFSKYAKDIEGILSVKGVAEIVQGHRLYTIKFAEKYAAHSLGLRMLSPPILCSLIKEGRVISDIQVLFPARLRSLIMQLQIYADMPSSSEVSRRYLLLFLKELIKATRAETNLKVFYEAFFKENESLFYEARRSAEASKDELFKVSYVYIETFVKEFSEQPLKAAYLDVLSRFVPEVSRREASTFAPSSVAAGGGAGAGSGSSCHPLA